MAFLRGLGLGLLMFNIFIVNIDNGIESNLPGEQGPLRKSPHRKSPHRTAAPHRPRTMPALGLVALGLLLVLEPASCQQGKSRQPPCCPPPGETEARGARWGGCGGRGHPRESFLGMGKTPQKWEKSLEGVHRLAARFTWLWRCRQELSSPG